MTGYGTPEILIYSTFLFDEALYRPQFITLVSHVTINRLSSVHHSTSCKPTWRIHFSGEPSQTSYHGGSKIMVTDREFVCWASHMAFLFCSVNLRQNFQMLPYPQKIYTLHWFKIVRDEYMDSWELWTIGESELRKPNTTSIDCLINFIISMENELSRKHTEMKKFQLKMGYSSSSTCHQHKFCLFGGSGSAARIDSLDGVR